MIKDALSNFLTRLRNATLAKHSAISFPYIPNIYSISKILIKEKFITQSIITSSNNKQIIQIKLNSNYLNKTLLLKRLSKPGRRLYSSYKKLNLILNSFKRTTGLILISTSNGILSHKQALFYNLGGELLFYIS